MSSGVPGWSVGVASVVWVVKEGGRDFSLFPLAIARVQMGGGDSFNRIGLHGHDVPMLIYGGAEGVSCGRDPEGPASAGPWAGRLASSRALAAASSER